MFEKLAGYQVAFVGQLAGVSRREARKIVRDHGGDPHDQLNAAVNLIVVGANELPMADTEDFLDEETKSRIEVGEVELIGETQFWEKLGLVENDSHIRKLYTPAMLAELLKVSLATIRTWQRRGLITPIKEVHKLPYFDFQEVATARRIAQLIAAGMSPKQIEKKLSQISRLLPDINRPLAQLSIIVEGREILLRKGNGLIEPSGQMRFDFDSAETPPTEAAIVTLDFMAEREKRFEEPVEWKQSQSGVNLMELAAALEDEDRLNEAIEAYRSHLLANGPNAETEFLLAELLYRVGDLPAARERYFVAIELDEHYVEARANLGCLLAELGDLELAISAFKGTLKYHHDYPDAHFHLARTLEKLERRSEARTHWQEFLKLSPESPWADEARAHLEDELIV